MQKTSSQNYGAVDGQRHAALSGAAIQCACADPLLASLLAAAAGYAASAEGQLFRDTRDTPQTLIVHCVKGGGWCELDGRLHTIRKGDLAVLPAGVPQLCGAHLSNPWTVHWVAATGTALPEYLRHLNVSRSPVVHVADDPQVSRLFSEIVQILERGSGFAQMLEASQALGHLLAVLIRKRSESALEPSDVVQKVAEAIIYISEHFDQPLRITALSRLANLSPAHFTVLFKQQTGCSPRDYLHLLRIHKACQLLNDTSLSVKEIASRLGYQDQFHFSRQFKAFQNTSPSEYRQAKSR